MTYIEELAPREIDILKRIIPDIAYWPVFLWTTQNICSYVHIITISLVYRHQKSPEVSREDEIVFHQ